MTTKPIHMKNVCTLFIAIFFATSSFSQGLWSQKTTYPAGTGSSAITFSIGSLGYMYTGGDSSTNNFFVYDPVANT